MTTYQIFMVVYAAVVPVAGIITFFIARDRTIIRLLSAILVGASWPVSLPVVLLFALF